MARRVRIVANASQTERSQLLAAKRALQGLSKAEVPSGLQKLAASTIGNVDTLLNYRRPKFKLRPGASYSKAIEAHKERTTGPTKKSLVAKADKIAKEVKKLPQYKTVEFKCVDDFYKCKKDEDKAPWLCVVAFLICLGRRLIPFMHAPNLSETPEIPD